MAEQKWDYMDSYFLTSISMPVSKLTVAFKKNSGVRIGECAVVSRNMHTFNPATPQKVNILQDADAGQSFYQRNEKGSVCHIDVFHQCGLVDHKEVARTIRKAVKAYNLYSSIENISYSSSGRHDVNLDYIDIQTGTGGGRITGSLQYGQKLSLRRAHENHVHIALVLSDEHLACLFYIVLATEQAIIASNMELRRNEKITHTKGGTGHKSDLSPYADQSDSFLQEKDIKNMPSAIKKHQIMQDATVVADHFDSIRNVNQILSFIEDNGRKDQAQKKIGNNGNAEEALACLSGTGIIDIKGNQIQLTNYGREFKNYLQLHLPEIEACLRQIIKTYIPVGQQMGCRHRTKSLSAEEAGKRVLSPLTNDVWCGELAVAETVTAAAKRTILENAEDFYIRKEDLRQFFKSRRSKSEVLLVIDASASMVGKRILAAKFLIRHLLLTTPDRIGVITFQQNCARVQVSLTRDISLIENSLHNIRATGATPLALGLKTCLNYLEQIKTRNPLIVLLTDGVPTLADMSKDPMKDALAIAEDIKVTGYDFVCIGLKPHRDYLTKIAAVAGGKVYLLDEIEKQVLVNAAWKQWNGRRG